MSDTDKVLPAYDPDTTPNALADVVGMDQEVLNVPVLGPETLGETFTDVETGQVRHVPARDDGRPVALASHPSKPWLDVQGHGKAADERSQPKEES